MGNSRVVDALLVLTLLAGVPAQAAPGSPLATAETNWTGVSLDLLSVDRKGSILTVKWAVRNTGETEADIRFGLTGKQITTYVLDEENGVKYYALTDQEGHTVASESEYLGSDTTGIAEKIPAGETRRYWMKLPAPPPEVKEVSLFFANTEPFESVAITERP